MAIQQPKSKAQRARELLASLPDDCGIMPATALDADENPVSMHEDGVFLRPTVWVTPETYQEQDALEGLLPCMKGMTDTTLPILEPTPPTPGD